MKEKRRRGGNASLKKKKNKKEGLWKEREATQGEQRVERRKEKEREGEPDRDDIIRDWLKKQCLLIIIILDIDCVSIPFIPAYFLYSEVYY